MLDNIPEELRLLPQWVNFDCVDGKKLPYTPGTNQFASSNQPTTWRTFEEAVADVNSKKRGYIGFTFSSTDPYVFVDLDDPEDDDQQRVLKRIKTYAQTSVSGEGVHLIAKGTFKGKGKHPAYPAAGLFKENRFCLMTGTILPNRGKIKEIPEADLQAVHSWLKSSKDVEDDLELTDYRPEIPDQTVVDMGCVQFTKFADLCNGNWEHYQEYHGDHSIADHAFLSILCDLTESNQQVRYLFSISGMWNDERAAKKSGHGLTGYVDRTIKKTRSEQARLAARMVDLDFSETPVEPVAVSDLGDRDWIDSLPSKLAFDLTDWLWRKSQYPLQESSLAACLSIFSTIVGRNYQTFTGSGLNIWTILLAGTGTGKNEYQNGISSAVKIVADASQNKGFVNLFNGELASGQAVEDVMATRNRLLSYFPEFDVIYSELTAEHTAPHFRSLKKAILNAYMQSAQHAYLPRRMKARQKGDAAPDETAIQAPNLVLAGECTPEAFFAKTSLADVSTGFLQRFTVLQAKKTSTSRRPSPDAGMDMPEELLQQLAELFLHCDQLEATKQFVTVMPSKQARQAIDSYRNTKRDHQMDNEGINEATKHYYTRAGLKVIRVASVLAVLDNKYEPIISKEHVNWAVKFIETTDTEILEKFHTGEIGNGQVKQENEVMKAALGLLRLDFVQRKKLGMSSKLAKESKIVSLAVLKKLVVGSVAFSSDRLGAVTAFEKCVVAMTNTGIFSKVSEATAWEDFKHQHGTLLMVNIKIPQTR